MMRNQTIRHRKINQIHGIKKLSEPESDNLGKDIRWTKYISEITYKYKVAGSQANISQ